MKAKDSIITLGRVSGVLLGISTAASAWAGSPSFAAQQTFAAGSNPSYVITADVNGDGKPDLIVADGVDNAVVVLINTTPAGATTQTYAAPQSFGVDDYTWSIAVADINGDGKPDLIVTYEDNIGTVSVLLNTTTTGSNTASFAAPVDFAVGNGMVSSVVAADLNGDNLPDLAVTNNIDGTVSVLINTTPQGATSPTFESQQVFVAGDAPSMVAVADINGDGLPDLIVTAEADDGIAVLLNTSSGGTLGFADAQPIFLGFEPNLLTAADFNGDGVPDLAVSDAGGNDLAILINNTVQGTDMVSFIDPQTVVTAHIPQSMVAMDFDGDGKIDLAVLYSAGASLTVFSNATATGDATVDFSSQQSLTVGNAPYALTAADVNGDDKPDLIAVNFDDSDVSVLLNTTGDSDSDLVSGSSATKSVPCKVGTFKSAKKGKTQTSTCMVAPKPMPPMHLAAGAK